ncbi:MAG: leucine-rich repeat domain-containing protein [Clostridiaceae bacterium]|nr:leucine-rich repeat domain-containing protein [Clostridiaceae bacterium]
MKKILMGIGCVCLCLAILVSAAVLGKKASAEDGWGSCGTDASWHFYASTGELAITGSGEITSASWSDYKNSITSVTIGEGITGIANASTYYSGVFYEYTKITSVTLPSTLQEIGNYAFWKCTALSGITLPDSSVLQTIGGYAFYKCTALTGVTLPDSLQSIGEYCFAYASLKEISIPAGVTVLSEGAFYGCSSLASVNLSEGIAELGAGCLYETGITSITIPSTVTTIGAAAFSGSELYSLEIPETVTSCGYYTSCLDLSFYYNRHRVYDENDDYYGYGYYYEIARNCSNLHYVAFNGSCAVDGVMFYSCSNLTTIKLGEAVTKVYGEDFPASVTAYYIPGTATTIEDFSSKNTATFYSVTGSPAYDYAGLHSNISFVDIAAESGLTQWNTLWDSVTTSAAEELAAVTATATPAPTATPTPTSTPTTVSTTKVAKVQGFKISTKKSKKIKRYTLKWSKVSGADGYEVYYRAGTSGSYKKYETVYSNRYIKRVSKKKKYSFKVRAYKIVDDMIIYGKYSKVIRK